MRYLGKITDDKDLTTKEYLESRANDNLADAFDTSKAYAVDSLVVYKGDVYKCITAKSAGAWDSSKFQRTTLAASGGGAPGLSVVDGAWNITYEQ